MAIDFSQVKSLTIPEGEVTKITDSSGNVLWQKITKGWHTIWEGSVKNDSATTIDIAALNDLSGTVTLRVTWSCSISGGSSIPTKYYNNNGWQNTTSTKPDSPFQFDLNADSNRSYIVGVDKTSDDGLGRSCSLNWKLYNRSFVLSGSEGMYGTGGVSLSMTVTKIEQYY